MRTQQNLPTPRPRVRWVRYSGLQNPEGALVGVESRLQDDHRSLFVYPPDNVNISRGLASASTSSFFMRENLCKLLKLKPCPFAPRSLPSLAGSLLAALHDRDPEGRSQFGKENPRAEPEKVTKQ